MRKLALDLERGIPGCGALGSLQLLVHWYFSWLEDFYLPAWLGFHAPWGSWFVSDFDIPFCVLRFIMRYFGHMRGALNVVEKNNKLHSLTDYHKMNFLNLINLWLDIIY